MSTTTTTIYIYMDTNKKSFFSSRPDMAKKIMDTYNGYSNNVAARKLGYSVGTLNNYVDEIVEELGKEHGYKKKGKGGGFSRASRRNNLS